MCPHLAWAKRGIAPVGDIRVWKTNKGHQFKVIKCENGFVHYAPWLWAQHFGPVPKGMCIRTKDNSLNVVIDNLEMISRAENAIRNSVNGTYLPAELRKTQSLIKQLNKKLKNMRNKIPDLNNHLFEQLERLNNEDLTPEQLKDEDYRDWETDRKSTRLNSSHSAKSRMPSSA